MNPPVPTADDRVITPPEKPENVPVPTVYIDPLTSMKSGVCSTVKLVFELSTVPAGVSAVNVLPVPLPPPPGCTISTLPKQLL